MDADRLARGEEERLAALRAAEEAAEASRLRAEAEAERLRLEMVHARLRAKQEAENAKKAALAAAETARKADLEVERRKKELETRRLMTAAKRSVRALQPTALTYVVVSYVFPEDVVRVSYVSGTKQWIAWEMPFTSILARRSSDSIFALYRHEDLHYLIGVDVSQWQKLLQERERSLASDRAWDLDHMPNAHPPMMPQPRISTRPASAPTWTTPAAAAAAAPVGGVDAAHHDAFGVAGMPMQRSGVARAALARAASARRRPGAGATVADVEGATIMAMYNDMIQEDRRSAQIQTEAAQRNEQMLGAASSTGSNRIPSTGQAFAVHDEEGGGDGDGDDYDDDGLAPWPLMTMTSSIDSNPAKKIARPATAPPPPRPRLQAQSGHAATAAQDRAANSGLDGTPRGSRAMSRGGRAGQQQQRPITASGHMSTAPSVRPSTAAVSRAPLEEAPQRYNSGRPSTAGNVRFFKATGTGRLSGEGYDAGFAESTRSVPVQQPQQPQQPQQQPPHAMRMQHRMAVPQQPTTHRSGSAERSHSAGVAGRRGAHRSIPLVFISSCFASQALFADACSHSRCRSRRLGLSAPGQRYALRSARCPRSGRSHRAATHCLHPSRCVLAAGQEQPVAPTDGACDEPVERTAGRGSYCGAREQSELTDSASIGGAGG